MDHLADSDPVALLRFNDAVVDGARRLSLVLQYNPIALSPRPAPAAALSAFV
ncbi:hypothetical protein HCU64_14810 [Methylobacterium sp. C25]|uniref:hypothetical protein n=1 Tax=Methylobacterium sp. C25 TaxID=2721622 RepID=UPI001F455C5F|nr:hypothetical protein [Methylobacterium sp. C25]MCE4225028.1 hypothetical protein [Methylobacterium sp. C25]